MPELIALIERAEQQAWHGLLFQNIVLCPTRTWLHRQYVDCAHLNRHMRRGLADQQGRYRGQVGQWGELGIAPDLLDFATRNVGEVKSSRSFPDASRAQLLFYVAVLSVNTGQLWSGTLRFPSARRAETLSLNTQAQERLVFLGQQLDRVLQASSAPTSTRGPICQHCSYRLLCWGRSSDDDDRR
jgi:CRISPR-associated exonuclease Cas4